MRAFLATVFALLLAACWSRPAYAHGMRSVSIDVTEMSKGRALVHVRTSQPFDTATVRFDAPCTASPADEDTADTLAVECPGSLAGAKLTVEGLGPVLSEAILVVHLEGGERVSRVLTADAPSYTLPVSQSGLGLARSYVVLGVVHILTGYDHLLFLLALVLLLKRPRAVIAAETAFTVSHSISFSATALGLVHVSAPAAEAAIALSLVLVALDVGRTGAATSTGRGAAMAFVFGLVHGLGFAGGLSEIGLPDHDVALALIGFAGGVEIGQIAFLAVALAVVYLVSRELAAPRILPRTVARTFEPALVRLIGGVASYWFIERTLVCLSRG
jgi:hydrogenase/urease accessory protein HupE